MRKSSNNACKLSANHRKSLAALQGVLLKNHAGTFEKLCAELMARLLEVPVYVSNSGYQFGADSGTAGMRNRRLRIECKRYQESTSSKSRSLKGQIEEAAQSDEALEAWVLMSTKTISEGDRNSLRDAGLARGLPVIIIDWHQGDRNLPALASLCAGFWELVEKYCGSHVGRHARCLQSLAASDVNALRIDLQTWTIGFKAVRADTHLRLMSIWNKRNEALAHLNQDAAGGSAPVLVKRRVPSVALSEWWADKRLGVPCVVHGREGYGKTWAVLEWLVSNADELPIVLTIPASAMSALDAVDENVLLSLIAAQLYSCSKSSLDERYWHTRVERLLKRPIEEGACFLLLFDGLNQNPVYQWDKLARTIQSEYFSGRLKVIYTVRTSYFEDIREFAKLAVAPCRVLVGPYEDVAGGELEQALRGYGVDPKGLHPNLLKKAIVPRLLPLIARFKNHVALHADSTVHRILWEYGCDVVRERTDASFDQAAFARWISERAKSWRDMEQRGKSGVDLSRSALVESVDSRDIGSSDIKRRLSDLVDGPWVEQVGKSLPSYVLSRETIILGLAVALLDELERSSSQDLSHLRSVLADWLEPVAALDETTDVLRAAIAILTAGASSVDGEEKTAALLIAWMHAQNPTSDFECDVLALGDQLPRSLLDMLENSSRHTHAVAMGLAAQALRRVNVVRSEDWQEIYKRIVSWCCRVLCPRPEDVAKGNEHYAAHEADAISKRIGGCSPGEYKVLGVPIRLQYNFGAELGHLIPAILEGHRLEKFPQIFAAATVNFAIHRTHRNQAWPGLRALLLYAGHEEAVARESVRALAAAVRHVEQEPRILPELRQRVASLLYWLSGEEADEMLAAQIEPRSDHGLDYAKDYLADPVHSFFAVEHRHVELVLGASNMHLSRRISRTKNHWTDPAIAAAPSLLDEIASTAMTFQMDELDSGPSQTLGDIVFKDLVGGFARFSPNSLALLVRRRFEAMVDRGVDGKYWAALHARQFLILADNSVSAMMHCLRQNSVIDKSEYERIANCWLLQLEVLCLPPERQLEVVAGGNAIVTVDLHDVLKPTNAASLKIFLRSCLGQPHAEKLALQRIFLSEIACDEELLELITNYLRHSDSDLRLAAIMALSSVAPVRLGHALLEEEWRANISNVEEAEYGSIGVIAASSHVNFERIVKTIAPWRWLDAAVERGGDLAELKHAASMLGMILTSQKECLPDLPGELAVKKDVAGSPRVSVRSRPVQSKDPFEAMQESHEEVGKRLNRLVLDTDARISEIRSLGAKLFLQHFNVAVLAAAWAGARSEVEEWLVGLVEETPAFINRVRTAEGLFISLCEVLLSEEPKVGVQLWRILRKYSMTRFLGRASISEFIHMLFRVCENDEVLALRESLLHLNSCHTDAALLDIVIAAEINGCGAWLKNIIKTDSSAPHAWRRKRALVLDALSNYPETSALVWPEGAPVGSWQALRDRMLLWTNRGALAKYWWRKFLAAGTAEESFAAWTVFLSCADRRAHIWMFKDADELLTDSELDRRKRLQWLLNYDELNSAMKKLEDETPGFSKSLFGQDAPNQWLLLDGNVFG